MIQQASSLGVLYMSFSRIVHSTIREYLRREEVNILRRRRLLALLKDKGRITYGHKGTQLDWKVRHKRAPILQYADAEQLSFPRRNKRLTATLPWRSYAVTDSVTKMERLQNKGVEAIVKIFANIGKELGEDIKDQFCEELFVDGAASGNEKRVHGLDTIFQGTSPNANGYIVTPAGTYAGLSMVLANYGGNWTGNWPDGYGDSHYDFWSGLQVDYTDTAWDPTTKTWPNTNIEAMRYGIINAERNADMLDVILLQKELYRQFLDSIDEKERIAVHRSKEKSSLVSLGFNDVQQLDGVDVTWEHGVPSGVGYGLCLEYAELCSLQDRLFSPEIKDFDISGMSFRFAVDFYGNLKFNPRCHVKFEAAT